jgi:hypothetical protein
VWAERPRGALSLSRKKWVLNGMGIVTFLLALAMYLLVTRRPVTRR